MADEPTPPAAAPASEPVPDHPAAAENPPAGDHPITSAEAQATPLTDGTVPTVLKTGDTNHSTANTAAKEYGKLSSVYRRADIFTTLITFAGAAVTAVLILGTYAYLTRSKPVAIPKTTKLEQAELDKLKAFFEGNSAGTPAEILTITSSALFKNRVALGADLKVVGGTQVTGPTALADLTVDKTSTLGVTNIRGQLAVSGPTVLQSPATITGGLTVNGNVTSSANGSFGGSLSAGILNVRDLSVSGSLNLNGHLNVGGQTPSASAAAGAGSGASASVDGNDSAGTATITTGSVPSNSDLGGSLVTITFRAPYARAPHIVITPNGRGAATLQPYIIKTATNFTISASVDPQSSTAYSFDYWVVQ